MRKTDDQWVETSVTPIALATGSMNAKSLLIKKANITITITYEEKGYYTFILNVIDWRTV